MLTVPLKNNKEEVIGVLQLINSQNPETGEVDAFDFYEQLVIETLASQAAVALNNQLVFKRQAELLKVERDVQVGHAIQADFLPKNEDMPYRKGWEIATCLHPARQVAGDFYDVFEMTHERIGFLVADVCDKGVGAALFMALMRSLIRAFAQQHYTSDLTGVTRNQIGDLHRRQSKSDIQVLPSAGSLALEKAVQMTNDYVAINHGMLGMFATMFFGVLNPINGSVLYINGGHNAPLIVDVNGNLKQQITQTGPAVGMFPGAHFEIQKTRLEPGDCLVAFTDGVPDARAPGGAFFTEKRLLELSSMPATRRARTAGTDRIGGLYAHLHRRAVRRCDADDRAALPAGREGLLLCGPRLGSQVFVDTALKDDWPHPLPLSIQDGEGRKGALPPL